MADPASAVFWDVSSGKPLLPQAQQAWVAAQAAGWGNPALLHRPGRLAAQAVAAGLALGRRRVGEIVVTCTIDHSSVLSAADAAGRRVGVPVDREGYLGWTAGGAPSPHPVALACLQVATTRRHGAPAAGRRGPRRTLTNALCVR